ncbi:response regulator [Maricaulis sp.]|uniref:response regulator n=1 Tax=unclassified Maricaulis TaxID=2632371 RepID=UPI001B15D9D8|nr:response regulator [Maricaulis sp.]MBO6796972.1 response regulator [Maricaulis sp.]
MGISVDIVLVDDDPDEHLLFHEDLKDAGVLFEFSAFTKADLALEHLQERSNNPVLLLTDLSLADDAALRLIEACQPYLNGGAVGVYSGTRNPEMELRCRDLGALFYIVKPVTRDKLVGAVEGLAGVSLKSDPDGKLSILVS